jgi:hypothetical protein
LRSQIFYLRSYIIIEGTLLKADHAMLFDLNAAAELN